MASDRAMRTSLDDSDAEKIFKINIPADATPETLFNYSIAQIRSNPQYEKIMPNRQIIMYIFSAPRGIDKLRVKARRRY